MPMETNRIDAAGTEPEPKLRWPINGLAYVAAFMGPFSAGPIVGILARDWRAVVIGLLVGIAITFVNGWLIGKFFEPWIKKFQGSLQKGTPKVLVNIAAFAWAIILCAIAMYSPFIIIGSTLSNVVIGIGVR
jgi:hypothetical protein